MSDSRMITAACPNCSKKFTLSSDLVGRNGRCDQCDSKFLIEEFIGSGQQKKTSSEISSFSTKKPVGIGGTVIALALLLSAGGVYYLYSSKIIKLGELPRVESKETARLAIDGTPDLAPLEKSFPVVKEFKDADIRKYQQTYEDVHLGWKPKTVGQADEAKRWAHHLGPLGIRIRSYVSQNQSLPAFSAIVPDCLRATGGGLALTAAEVVTIAPGSPAEGYLDKGDLIIGIEGEMLKSGNDYKPEWEFMHKDAREIQLMLGEKLDVAQARGDVRLAVMRYPKMEQSVFSENVKQSDGRCEVADVRVSEGDEIHLRVKALGRNDSNHFTWLSPTLNGPNGSLDLARESEASLLSSSTGWGQVTRGKKLSGEPVDEPCLSVHANSEVVFRVPKGFERFSTSMATTNIRANLQAEVVIKKGREALPVSRKELWKGTGGNSSVGVQNFSVEIDGAGTLTLESSQFDDNIHGDGTRWCDLVLEGDYGSKSLLEMPRYSVHNGYGRARVDLKEPFVFKEKKYKQSLYLHAQGEVSWQIPKGTKRVSGTFIALSYGKVQPKIQHRKSALPLTGIHKEKVVNLRIPIGKVGSYSPTFPKDCKKTEVTVSRHTKWLASHQRENGTWPRLRGYTSDGWDTSWCALALMSSGDKGYDDQVKKAAYHIAYESVPSTWTAERAMRLIFLSEYYLRTKDEKILAGVQAAYHQLIDCCKNDYMAGHKVDGFGYGRAGQHYGTGHLALAIALASRTPITVNKELVGNIIRHAGEVCVNGTYGYGRGRRMRRDSSRKHSGGNAMVGPGILGVLIGGGHTSAIKEAGERWGASIGDGDNSHATSSLAFIFSSLAMASSDEALFLKHMQNFKYKMTIDDNWEGGYLKSAFPLDFQGGESVTASLIRSAGSVLVLNSLKHNLAITGKKEFLAKERIENQAVSEWGGQIHSYYLRNWCLAKELLSENAPSSLTEGIAKMHGLERTTGLVPQTKKLVESLAPAMIKSIAENNKLDELSKAYAIELISGLDFRISAEIKGENQGVDLEVLLPMHQLNWLDDDKEELFKNSVIPLKANVTIEGVNLTKEIRFKVDSLDGFNLDTGVRRFKGSAALRDSNVKEFGGVAQINFILGGQMVSYKRPLKFNTLLVSKNEVNYRILKLKLKTGPRAFYQSQPLLISGIAFDCMYPIEKLPPVNTPDESIVDVHEGDDVVVEISSENMICGTVYSLTYEEVSQVDLVLPSSLKVIRGSVEGDMNAWSDHSGDTSATLKMKDGKGILEYDFGKPVVINGLDAKGPRPFLRVWYNDGEDWVPLVWDSYNTNSNQNPVFPNTEAQLWRVECCGRDLNFKTLRFYKSNHQVSGRKPLIQSLEAKFLPPIKPE